MKKEAKTPQELGISEHEWVDLAESLLISREFSSLLSSSSPLAQYHRMRVEYLEEFFGISQKNQQEDNSLTNPTNMIE